MFVGITKLSPSHPKTTQPKSHKQKGIQKKVVVFLDLFSTKNTRLVQQGGNYTPSMKLCLCWQPVLKKSPRKD